MQRTRKREPERPEWAWRLHRRMKEQGVTNLALGLRLGHPDGGRVGHYRRGRNEPAFEDLVGICAALDCSLDWLVKGERGAAASDLAFAAQVARFFAAVQAGVEPVAYWEGVIGRRLTEAERAVVGADPAALREFLATHPLAAWESLAPEEQAAIQRVVGLLAKPRPTPARPGPETSP